MEIGGFVGDPYEEFRDGWMLAKRRCFGPASRQLDIAEIGMNRAVTDGMERHDRPPAAAFRHRMMPLHAPPQPTRAEPTDSFHSPFRSTGLECVLAH